MIKNPCRNFAVFTAAVLCLLTIRTGIADAQEINKEVLVVRPYEPTFSDAEKVNFLPSFEEAGVTTPEFTYTITPKRFLTEQKLNPIKPARMVAISVPKIYNSWLKVGLGNHLTPLVEFNYSNLHSKDGVAGLYLYHKSSNSRITLPNEHKVPAGYIDENLNVYGKKFFYASTLAGNLRFEHNAFNHYGYNTFLFADSLPVLERDSIRLNTYLFGADAVFASHHADSSRLGYRISLTYEHFRDDYRNREDGIMADASFNKKIYGMQAGLDLAFDNFSLTSSLDTSSNTVVRINPRVSKRNDDWKFTLGFQAVADISDITNFYFYPMVNLDILIIEDVLVPFLGLTGGLTNNNYRMVMEENRFIKPGLRLLNGSNTMHIYGGIRGSITDMVRFHADVSYSVNKNMHFFVNDTLNPLHNQFIAEYNDVDLVTYHGQLSVRPSASLEFSAEGSYYDYNMFDIVHPWHKPEYDLNFDASFRLKEKAEFNASIRVLGDRWMQNIALPERMEKMDPYADVNLKARYNVSRVFTLFLDLYNITNRSYAIWNQFPSQGFNFLAGFSFKL